jgi:hypothetical protein
MASPIKFRSSNSRSRTALRAPASPTSTKRSGLPRLRKRESPVTRDQSRQSLRSSAKGRTRKSQVIEQGYKLFMKNWMRTAFLILYALVLVGLLASTLNR